MDKDRLTVLLNAWDEMDNAAQKMATSLPSQMTAAVDNLEVKRLGMRKALQDYAYRIRDMED